ncbi:MAG: rod shape-determining protein MreC [Pseudomonadota bacterium]
MPIGTIDRTPPPFFRQGPSALTKLILCSALALFLMVADNRFAVTRQLRAVVATALYYPQQALLVPVEAIGGIGQYFMGLQGALSSEQAARRDLAAQAERALRVDQLATENAHLRGLLELRPSLTVRSQAAQVLYEASDPYSRKVVIDRGTTNGVALASPVINETGVLGQVTRVYPLSSEVTLLTDKDAAIPVLNTRTQVRSAAFGSAGAVGGGMEMRFMAGNADVQPGDVLTTTGVDGIYPPGLPVAKVTSVDRKLDSGFARILLAPNAKTDGVRHVLVIEPIGLQMPARPEVPPPLDPKAAAAAKKGAKAPAAKASAASGATP